MTIPTTPHDRAEAAKESAGAALETLNAKAAAAIDAAFSALSELAQFVGASEGTRKTVLGSLTDSVSDLTNDRRTELEGEIEAADQIIRSNEDRG